MDFLSTPEINVGDFLFPWGMVIGVIAFLLTWVLTSLMEHRGWTRGIWQYPLFFVASAVLIGSLLGLIFAP